MVFVTKLQLVRSMTMDVDYTNHSLKRMQQRGISREAVEHILKYGEVFYDGHGAQVFFINKKNRDLLPSELEAKDLKKIKKQLNAYVVHSMDGSLITVGHSYRRRRN